MFFEIKPFNGIEKYSFYLSGHYLSKDTQKIILLAGLGNLVIVILLLMGKHLMIIYQKNS